MRASMRALIPILGAALALAAAPAAQAQDTVSSYVYVPCAAVGDASVVEVIGASCGEAEALAAAIAAAPVAGERAVLLAGGWTPLRARSSDDRGSHDLVALRGAAALRIHRAGAAPDLDGWEAGRELILARKRLVGGKPVPKGAVLCTSSWLVRLPNGRLGGLTAAHCGGLRRDGTVQRHYAGLRRPPQPGIILGRVKRILTRSRPLDALLLPVPSGAARSRQPVVNRGVTRPPWRVAGVGQPTAGRDVCFTGRTSGVDQCGAIQGAGVRRAELLVSVFAGVVVRCTTMRAQPGDSGGPVYTAPRADGTVYAIGITTLIVGDSAAMCFTPIAPVLRGLGARLVTG
jgi:hypothetical protein